MNTTLVIRSALPADEASWRALWRGYCRFHDITVSDETTRRTWVRILDPDSSTMCIVAELNEQVCGFANCVVHENTLESQPVCLLEDLYVQSSARGRGIGSALIEWLLNSMRAEGWARVYWMSPQADAASRRLAERYADADGFIRYTVRAKP